MEKTREVASRSQGHFGSGSGKPNDVAAVKIEIDTDKQKRKRPLPTDVNANMEGGSITNTRVSASPNTQQR